MNVHYVIAIALVGVASAGAGAPVSAVELHGDPIDVRVPDLADDRSVKRDYSIVYVRVPRAGGETHPVFAEVFHPAFMDPGGDLMLLKPDGTEEVLVEGSPGSVLDPYVSFDGQWVYYARLENLTDVGGGRRHGGSADIYKIHVASRRIVRLTEQQFTPNTGMTNWTADDPGYGVFNLGPCPLPGGKVMFVSNRNAFRPNKGYTWPCLQLFVMDDDGRNVEMIGYINLGSALHPTILRDGRVLFSSYEAQGLRDIRVWGLWSIHPDGTNWEPVVSALFHRPNAIHFQTQLSDGNLIVEDYYNLNNNGFGPLYKLPERPPASVPGFGPAYVDDPRNAFLRMGRHSNGKPAGVRSAFSPVGIEAFTPFVNSSDNPADTSVLDDKDSPRVGKFTHPAGAPDNHLLVCYSPGPANHHYGKRPESHPVVDSGLYLVKDGRPIGEPAEMRLIKNDPKYNEQWPRALVSYRRIYGVDEPRSLTSLHKNDGVKSKHLPEGTPFGLVGTSSLYKRESFPNGAVPEGSVTAGWVGAPGDRRDPYQGWDPFNGENPNRSWTHQGAEAGRYDNADIHAVRIVALEGTTDDGGGPNRRFYNHANERMRILGENRRESANWRLRDRFRNSPAADSRCRSKTGKATFRNSSARSRSGGNSPSARRHRVTSASASASISPDTTFPSRCPHVEPLASHDAEVRRHRRRFRDNRRRRSEFPLDRPRRCGRGRRSCDCEERCAGGESPEPDHLPGRRRRRERVARDSRSS